MKSVKMSSDATGGEKIPVLKRSPGQLKKQYQFRHSDSESDTVSLLSLPLFQAENMV